VPFAAARDHLFPRSLAAIHPRFQTPFASLILQAVLSSLLLLAVGKFQALFSLAIVSEWMFYALTCSTVFVFRRREPGRQRPYSVNGYPVTPALFILAAVMIMVFSFVTEPRNSAMGAAVILLGVPLYGWMRVRQRRAA
jgi:APA family basic amino acid/polyamine antiporter